MTGFEPYMLSWLPAAPQDFRSIVKKLAAGELLAGQDLQRTVNFALNLDQLLSVSRAFEKSRDKVQPEPLSSAKLAVLLDGTTDFIVPAIRASAPRHGTFVDIYDPGFGQSVQAVMDPNSGLAAFKPDIVLVGSDHRTLGLDKAETDPGRAGDAVDNAFARFVTILDGLDRIGATAILQTVPVPPEPWCGHFDASAQGSPAGQVRSLNERLTSLAAERSAVLLDVASLADLVGRSRWFDHGLWNRAKVPMHLDFVPLYADHVSRLLGAMRGKSRKCLVLDLDNTLWGGVIGDDGLDGIQLGQGSSDGEAFLAIQAYALNLKARGVVLAVVSKNEEDAALLPFRKHPDMLLREEDIAVFIANWDDKATNIKHVARSLNIGVDALAFLDDNPAERERVRQMLPEVAVPELPDDPAFYPAALAHSGVFETVGLSADDAKRADQYRENAARNIAKEKIGDYDEYLGSLDMVCDIRPFDEVGRTRIAQLINKSNQFNVTTRRYSEAQVAAMQTDGDLFDLQIRLTDKFGDNGMISVVIFRRGETEWVCDTWLMSCRVLGRRVEEAALNTVAEAARAAGATALIGEYIPSAKNKMVEGLFERLGFEAAGDLPDAEGGKRWRLELGGFSAPDLPMKITGIETTDSEIGEDAA